MNPSFFPFPEGGRWLWRTFRGVVRSGSATFNVVTQGLLADGPDKDIGIVVGPKGAGAFSLQEPDGTIAHGNARGANAVDLQMSRTAATQVASGQGSIVAGLNNTASGSGAACFGTTCSCAGALAAGFSSTASGNNAVALGSSVTADGIYSRAGGRQCTTRGITGADVYASDQFATLGDAQRRDFVLRRQTTDATATVLTADANTPGTSNQIVLPNDSTFCVQGRIVARRTDADNESAGYTFSAVIDRNANAASTALVGTATVTAVAEDTAAWDVTVTADTTNGCLAITVTGEASKTIRWVAWAEAVEVVG